MSETARNRPNYVVELRFSGRRPPPAPDLESLIKSLPDSPDESSVSASGCVAGWVGYARWKAARDAAVLFWRRRLKGHNRLTPAVKFLGREGCAESSDLVRHLCALFASRVRFLLRAEAARRCQEQVEAVKGEIAEISDALGQRNRIAASVEMLEKRKALVEEVNQMTMRLEEYKAAMLSILNYLDGPKWEECRDEVEIFELYGTPNWVRIEHLLLRECRRLDDELPIYGHRRELLRQIHNQQAIVLIGETGSGKSTQLVQYLVDSGLVGGGSIVCTQPRKIAAMSLAQRVKDESNGCFPDSYVTYCPGYSSSQKFDSKVIFMTDNCLLQHYMSDTKLGNISYIIIDEAHERSLNTDLLLALLKKLLLERHDLRLIIMSATADADKLSRYFFGCSIFHVSGRNYPVEVKYVPDVSTEISWATISTFKQNYMNCASYVIDAVRLVTEIHKQEEDGAVLVFLTSQWEVEWACDNFQCTGAVPLPLHGKLSFEEQNRVFQNTPGSRKIIFATNLAETSLTIPGIRYVVDSGMVKESKFEASTGMNVLRVCRVSQSSAMQRAGRAGRTGPGKCYRLYSESDLQCMSPHQEPEICRVHLGIAVLRILALRVQNVQDFDFVDVPSSEAIELAVRSLIQLGAVCQKGECLELTSVGHKLVKLGFEPRIGRLVLDSFDLGMGREGIVLASVMGNASNIFCRVGNDEEKLKSDSLKVQFCHPCGDLFTLLSVYKKWEEQHAESRNMWCWNNSINAKTMRRCRETLVELEKTLQHELQMIVPSFWKWGSHKSTLYDKLLKKVILTSLVENVAMYSGAERLGYEVALTGQHVQLHPSCSLLACSQTPTWVVFSEILSISNQYLVCVTSVDKECFLSVQPPPPFDFNLLEAKKMHRTVIGGVGTNLLKRLCGKSNSRLRSLICRLQNDFHDNRIHIDVDFVQRQIIVLASEQHLEKVSNLVNDVLESEAKWLEDECVDKYLFPGGPGFSPPLALLGSGAEIKHLELDNRYLSVEVFHRTARCLDDKELLSIFDKKSPGIANFHKYGSGSLESDTEKWGRITFLNPQFAIDAVEKLNGVEFCGYPLKVLPYGKAAADNRNFPYPALKARITWPRRPSRGVAALRFMVKDINKILEECRTLIIGRRCVRCELSRKYDDSVIVSGLDIDTTDAEIMEVFSRVTGKKVLDIFRIRGEPISHPSADEFSEILRKELAPCMQKKTFPTNNFSVQVFPPEHCDHFIKAVMTFDGNLHLEAAKALENIQGKVLPGCLPWQKIECHQTFQSSLSCPAPVYFVIKTELELLLRSFKYHRGVLYDLEKNENGSYRVKIFSNATKIVAESRKPLEELMKGKIIKHPDLSPAVIQQLYSKEGSGIKRSVEKETNTYILHDRHNMDIKVFGPRKAVSLAENKLITSLVKLYENKQLEIPLRCNNLPHNLMLELVQKFGPDLHGLKQKVPGVDILLNARRQQLIIVRGSKELKQKVEEIILEVAKSLCDTPTQLDNLGSMCPICLCEVDDCYKLEACGHEFCCTCLIDQCESAIRNRDILPLVCTRGGCKTKIVVADLRSLLPSDKMEDLFRASLGKFVASSNGTYQFCPTPDCPSVYRSANSSTEFDQLLFSCSACLVDTCRSCHLEYHPSISCEMYKEFKEDPDSSLKAWRIEKDDVKDCPSCGYVIEKEEGCNHMECKCGSHICWTCLEYFTTSDDCYGHLREVHGTFI